MVITQLLQGQILCEHIALRAATTKLSASLATLITLRFYVYGLGTNLEHHSQRLLQFINYTKKCVTSVWKSEEKILTFASLIFLSKITLFEKKITRPNHNRPM